MNAFNTNTQMQETRTVNVSKPPPPLILVGYFVITGSCVSEGCRNAASGALKPAPGELARDVFC